MKGRSKASNSIYLRDIRIRIFGRAVLGRFVREVTRAVSTTGLGVFIVVGTGSRKVGAPVLYDLLKYIVEDRFGVVRVFYVLRDAQDVAALPDVVLHVVVVALVGELGHFDSIVAERVRC